MTYPVDRHFFALADALRATQMEVRKELVWVKDRFSFWPGAQYQQRHEPILVCARVGRPVGSDVPANESTVLEVPAPKAHDLHATAKPIDLWSRLVKYHVPVGEIVYDPFTGSGTTIIAAEQLGRRCFAIEIEPRYVDVAIRRWEEHAGRKAEKENSNAV
jgi:DNA modification methylase